MVTSQMMWCVETFHMMHYVWHPNRWCAEYSDLLDGHVCVVIFQMVHYVQEFPIWNTYVW